MPRYIAFMRAINVGGRFIKMAALAEHYRSLGHTDVETFINSGNVIFSSRARSAARVESDTEARIQPLLGFRSELFVRTPVELAEILARADRVERDHAGATELNVGFLKDPLCEERRAALDALQTDVDAFEHEERQLYWACRVKQSESKVSNSVFERRLRARTTLRRVAMLRRLAVRLDD